jgi:DNA primase
MITQESIDTVKETVDIIKVVERSGVKLKKKGSSFSGCCPFHNEQTPSFSVSESKGIYKCFGCGVGGDAISFVMAYEKIEFLDAIRLVAEWQNITLEETQETEEHKEIRDKRTEMLQVNTAVAKLYYKHLLDLPDDHIAKKELLENRLLKQGTIIEFQIGFAPDEWRFISPSLIEKGKYQPASDLGLIGTTNEKTFDTFKNRIIFPIHNEKGQVVGFGGRTMEKKKETPKYLNSKESLVFLKTKVLYGLYQAQKAIRTLGFAIIVEGYFDVMSMQQSGALNTVGTCGTALTEDHVKLLKRFTNHVVLMGDGDSAGLASNLKSVDILLKYDFKVEICLLPASEIEGEKMDPDIFARQHPLVEDPEEQSPNQTHE